MDGLPKTVYQNADPHIKSQIFLNLAWFRLKHQFIIYVFLRAMKSLNSSLMIILNWKSRCCIVPQVLVSSRRPEEEAYPWSSYSRPRNLARISCSRCTQRYQSRFKKLRQNHTECKGPWKIHIWRCSGQFAILFGNIWNRILCSEIYVQKNKIYLGIKQ